MRPMTSATVTPLFTPSIDAMTAHVEHLFGGHLSGFHNGLVELAWTDTKPDGTGRYRLSHARLYSTDQLDELVADAARLNTEPMCNVYIGAALRKPDTAPFGRTTDTDVLALPALYADLDDSEASARARDLYQAAKPSLVVLTGKDPHKRAQLWWRLDEPSNDPAAWRAHLERIGAHLAGDMSVCNPSRVMRLAGSIAWPVKQGRVVELTEIVPLKSPGLPVYRIEQILAAFPERKAEPPPRSEEPPRQEAPRDAAGGNFFRTVNTLALQSLGSWVPDLFGSDAVPQRGTGAWRVSSDSLGRDLEEDLSISPQGIVDFGVHDMGDPRRGKRTPIDLVMEHGGAPNAKEAAFWLCKRLYIDPAALGWGEARKEHTWTHGEPGGEHEATPREEAPAPGPFRASELTGKAPEREWLVQDWLAAGVVNSLYGAGGVGKTLMAQQLAYCLAIGAPFIGIPTTVKKVFAVLCEDDRAEIHRRHDALKAGLGHAIGNPFDNVLLWSRTGVENIFVTWSADGQPAIAQPYQDILDHTLIERPDLLILDTLADFYGGNEIVRAQVNHFVKAVLGRLIREAEHAGFKLTILLLAHPSTAGVASGTGLSGSTAWENAVRARLYLKRPEEGDSDERELVRSKANYAKAGDETKLRLLYRDGVFVPADVGTDETNSVLRQAKLRARVLVQDRWMAKKPYSTKKGHARHIFGALKADLMSAGFEQAVAIQAIREIIDNNEIAVSKSNGRSGWKLLDDD